MDHVEVFVAYFADVFKVDAVGEGLLGGGEVLPVLRNVHQVPLVNRNHPVVRKVLVDYLSHLGVFPFKDLGAEGEEYKDDLSLVGEGHGPVFGVRVCGQLVIDIIIFECVDEGFDDGSVDGVDGEPAEEVEGVVLGDGFLLGEEVVGVAGVLDEATDLVAVVAGVLALEPDVADDHAFPGECGDESVHEEEHDPVEVEDLDDEAFALLVLEDAFEVVVDEVALMHVLDEALHFSVVGVDGVEELEEALDDLHVGLAEALFEVDEVDVALDLVVVVVGVLDVGQVEQDLLVLLLLVVKHRRRRRVYHLPIYRHHILLLLGVLSLLPLLLVRLRR
mmetsp:Transcript_36878/g.35602  ORF Transcript_36878/g.35602 Transcript_36878/m.35602 type:complete len:333 (-) Transcript_36878:113-1111(-)